MLVIYQLSNKPIYKVNHHIEFVEYMLKKNQVTFTVRWIPFWLWDCLMFFNMHGPKIITQNENKLEYPEHTHTHTHFSTTYLNWKLKLVFVSFGCCWLQDGILMNDKSCKEFWCLMSFMCDLKGYIFYAFHYSHFDLLSMKLLQSDHQLYII